jgi:hypothetical protein
MIAILNVRAREITKSGIALSRNSVSPWMEKPCLAIPQTAYSNKPVCRNSFNVAVQNAKFKDLTPSYASGGERTEIEKMAALLFQS